MDECVVFSKLGRCLLRWRTETATEQTTQDVQAHQLCALLLTLQRFSNGCATFAKLHGRCIALAEGTYIGVAVLCSATELRSVARLKAMQVASAIERLYGGLLAEMGVLERAEMDRRMVEYTVKDELAFEADRKNESDQTMTSLSAFQEGYVRPLLSSSGDESTWLARLLARPGILRVVIMDPIDGSSVLDQHCVALSGQRQARHLQAAVAGRHTALWRSVEAYARDLLEQDKASEGPRLSATPALLPFGHILSTDGSPSIIACLHILHTRPSLFLVVFISAESESAFAPLMRVASRTREFSGGHPNPAATHYNHSLAIPVRRAISQAVAAINVAFAGGIPPPQGRGPALHSMENIPGQDRLNEEVPLSACLSGCAITEWNDVDDDDQRSSDPQLEDASHHSRSESLLLLQASSAAPPAPSVPAFPASKPSVRARSESPPLSTRPAREHPPIKPHAPSQPRQLPPVRNRQGDVVIRPLPFVRSVTEARAAEPQTESLSVVNPVIQEAATIPRPPVQPRPVQNYQRRQKGSEMDIDVETHTSLRRSTSDSGIEAPQHQPLEQNKRHGRLAVPIPGDDDVILQMYR